MFTSEVVEDAVTYHSVTENVDKDKTIWKLVCKCLPKKVISYKTTAINPQVYCVHCGHTMQNIN